MGKLQDLKTKIGIKPKKTLSHETLKGICKLIKEEYPDWAELNDEVLIMFLKLVIREFPSNQFDSMSEEDIRTGIKNAFVNATKKHKDLKNIATPYEIMRFNNAYENGKKLGVSSKKMLNSVFKKLVKRAGKDKNNTNIDDVIEVKENTLPEPEP